jgi:hypothetical protein
MPYLYRTAVAIMRKQPYIEWANSFDDGGPKLTLELAKRDTIYLVPSAVHEQSVEQVLAEWWPDIFEEQLADWMEDEKDWPPDRTREMFDEWFDGVVTDAVVDLAPEEPLTETDMELADLDVAMHTCAWCGRELEKGEGRFSGFTLEDRERLANRQGLVLDVLVRTDRVVTGVVTPADSQEAQAGDDVLFRVCSRACERPLKKLVPAALRKQLR